MSSIKPKYIKELQESKPLLAFSAGVDSTALFFLLLEYGIRCDLALVNYGIRAEADIEADYAKRVANRYGVELHYTKAPKWNSNFEHNARDFRYHFFEDLIDRYNYTHLVTAHQLDDKIEWFMMRFAKGSGVSSLIGIGDRVYRFTQHNTPYILIRPLIDTPRYEIEEYLKSNSIEHYIDSSNSSKKYERNRFRPLCRFLAREYHRGIIKSFEYLNSDYKRLIPKIKRVLRLSGGWIVECIECKGRVGDIVDKILKIEGYMLSTKEREKLNNNQSLVAGRKWSVEISNNYIYIAPYIKNITMPKSFREKCRVYAIPPHFRPWLYRENIEIENIDKMDWMDEDEAKKLLFGI